MKPDEALQPVAKKVRRDIARHAESIPLDQPFPEELPSAPKPGAREDFEEDKKTEEEKKKEKSKDEPAKILEPAEDKSEEPPTIAGYKPEDLLAAPLKPPEPVKTESRRATLTTSVVFLVGLGVILLLIGLVLVFTASAILGFIIALIGALAVVASVFTPFRK